MSSTSQSVFRRALQLNLDSTVYGTFAEIGAGQEVARIFFQAGAAAGTVAKTMSAYDMTISDSIYGPVKSRRYVSSERLASMLDHEYGLLVERLGQARGENTRFFAFANTVTARSFRRKNECHGWLGLRFQLNPQGPVNNIVLHVRMLDDTNLQQQEALGILGVNLVSCAFYFNESLEQFTDNLVDSLSAKRIEIDMIRFDGDDLEHIDNRLASLELVEKGLTRAVMFCPDGQVIQPSEALYKKPLFVQRGSFRPVTKTHLEIEKYGLQQFLSDHELKREEVVVLSEITMKNLMASGKIEHKDFLERVDALAALGRTVLISNYTLFFQLRQYFGRYTSRPVGMVISAAHLELIFDGSFYKNLFGGLLEALGKLIHGDTKLYVYPHKLEHLCTTAQTFRPSAQDAKLYEYLLERGQIVDIHGCDEANIAIHSQDVWQMIQDKNGEWKDLVPEKVRQLIESRQLFGHG